MSTLIGARHLFRPRICETLKAASADGAVFVAAAAGSGKTRAVLDYVQTLDGDTVWLDIQSEDNQPKVFFDRLYAQLPKTHLTTIQELMEVKPAGEMNNVANYPLINEYNNHGRLNIVLDDFHLLNNEDLLAAIGALVSRLPEKLTLFLLSRISPASEAGAYIAAHLPQSGYKLLHGDALIFSQDEIHQLMMNNDIMITQVTPMSLLEETDGWVWGAEYLVESLTLEKKAIDFNINDVKKIFFAYYEEKIFSTLSKETQHDLLCVSLMAHFSQDVDESLIEQYGKTGFRGAPWQVLGYLDYHHIDYKYHMHPVLYEFLLSRQHLLSEQECLAVYSCGAAWGSANGYLKRAFYCYSKLCDYAKMLEILMNYPFITDYATSEFFLNILDDMPEPESPQDDPLAYLTVMKGTFSPRFLVNMERYDEAESRALAEIAKWEQLHQELAGTDGETIAIIMLYSLYNTMSFIRINSCTLTHVYDFASWTQKARALAEQHPLSINMSESLDYAVMRSYSCFVGANATSDELDRFNEEISDMIACFSIGLTGIYTGYPDLCRCEIAFFRGDSEQAKILAQRTIASTASLKQYGVETSAIYYLLKLAVMEGNFHLVEEMLDRLAVLASEPEFVHAQKSYGIALAETFATLGLLSLIPPWIRMFSTREDTNFAAMARENLMRAKCLISSKDFIEALTILNLPSFSIGDGRFLFAQLYRSVFTALAQYGLGDITAAIASFEEAYLLSQNGELVMPFIETGNNMSSFLRLLMAKENCKIPFEWLNTVEKHVLAFNKRAAIVANGFKRKYGLNDDFNLSERETQLLNDICCGLTREEIAATRFLSVNTVKTQLKTLYAKMGANSNIEIMRIALEHNLLPEYSGLIK